MMPLSVFSKLSVLLDVYICYEFQLDECLKFPLARLNFPMDLNCVGTAAFIVVRDKLEHLKPCTRNMCCLYWHLNYTRQQQAVCYD